MGTDNRDQEREKNLFINILRFYIIIFYITAKVREFCHRVKEKVCGFFAPKRSKKQDDKETVAVEQDENWASGSKAVKKMFESREGTYVDFTEEKRQEQ